MSSFSERKYEVLVKCMTYNQSIYILDALNGFAMQRTDFPFVCVVMDDASTDGEPEVIRGFLEQECAMDSAEYSEIEDANIVIVPHKTNVNCTFAVYFLKRNLFYTDKKGPMQAPWREKCRYEALCEGDDYWIDPEKLQKQVDLLNSRPDLSLCFHTVKVLDTDGQIKDDMITRDVPGESTIYDLVEGNYIHTPSVMFRLDLTLFDEMQQMGRTYVGDYILWMLCAKRGNLLKISDPMAVYRSGVGIWSSKSDNYRYSRWIVTLSKMYSHMDDNIKRILDDKINEIVKMLSQKGEMADLLRSSSSFKVGHILVAPISRLMSFFHRR